MQESLIFKNYTEMSDFDSVELNGSRLVISGKGENDMGKYQKLSEQILENVGGKDNISAVTHCVTRLRLTLKNNDLVNKEAINKLEGVLGSQFNAGQYQVIIGQQIPEVAADFAKVSGISLGEIVDENLDGADTKEKINVKRYSKCSFKYYFCNSIPCYSYLSGCRSDSVID